MMSYLALFFEFLKTGLFAVGGGLATVPFVMQMARNFPWWFAESAVPDMLAVAQLLPGAIGVNLAAYSGLTAAGSWLPGTGGAIAGAFSAAFGLIIPSIIVITLVSKFLAAFKENPYVQAVFRTLRPCALGLLAAAGFGVWRLALWNSAAAHINWLEVALFAAFAFAVLKFKKHPALYIGCGAIPSIPAKTAYTPFAGKSVAAPTVVNREPREQPRR
jgi:chromate transporter